MDYDEGDDDNDDEEDEDATDECDSQRIAAKKKRIASGNAEPNAASAPGAEVAGAASCSKAVTNNNPSTSKCGDAQPSTSQSASLDGVAMKPLRNALGLDDKKDQGHD